MDDCVLPDDRLFHAKEIHLASTLVSAMGSVLVSNAEYKQTLAIVRSLGRRGITVACMSSHPRALSFYSKYCSQRIEVPAPGDPEERRRHLLSTVKDGDYEVLVSVGLDACLDAAHMKEELEQYIRVPISGPDSMEIAARKHRTIRLATGLGVTTPATLRPASVERAIRFAKEIGFPVVVKDNVGSGGRGVRVARTESELAKAFGDLTSDGSHPIVQEYIPGCGFGYSAIARDGGIVAEVIHKRVHEYPPEGGPSTLAKTVDVPKIREAGQRILKGLRWTGVAMVEFRGDESSGHYKLIEVNPKFWGSLELGIVAGVDFPYLLYALAMGHDLPSPKARQDVHFRWVFPDYVFALETHGLLSYFAGFLNPSLQHDIDMADPGPVCITARRMLGHTCRQLRLGRFSPAAGSI